MYMFHLVISLKKNVKNCLVIFNSTMILSHRSIIKDSWELKYLFPSMYRHKTHTDLKELGCYIQYMHMFTYQNVEFLTKSDLEIKNI